MELFLKQSLIKIIQKENDQMFKRLIQKWGVAFHYKRYRLNINIELNCQRIISTAVFISES